MSQEHSQSTPLAAEGPLTREEVLDVSRALFQHYGWNNPGDLIMRNRIQRMRDMALATFAVSEKTFTVTEAMVSRFLSWKLPEDFHPDAGISFKREYNENTPYPGKHQPIGTNLLNADQAKAMLEHVLDAAPQVPGNGVKADEGQDDRHRIVNTPAGAASGSPSAAAARIGTHWEGCGLEGGHRHYECLQREYRELLKRSATASLTGDVREFMRISVLGRGDVPMDIRNAAKLLLERHGPR